MDVLLCVYAAAAAAAERGTLVVLAVGIALGLVVMCVAVSLVLMVVVLLLARGKRKRSRRLSLFHVAIQLHDFGGLSPLAGGGPTCMRLQAASSSSFLTHSSSRPCPER